MKDNLHVEPGTVTQTPPPDLDVWKVEQALLLIDEQTSASSKEAWEALQRIKLRKAAAAPRTVTTGAGVEQLTREFTEQVGPTATLNMWRDLINAWADSKGWNDASIYEADNVTIRHEFIGEQLMLMTTELAEAQEDNRKGLMSTYLEEGTGKPCGFPSELADTIIRILHLCARMGINVEQEVAIKMAFNYSRARRHGGLRS